MGELGRFDHAAEERLDQILDGDRDRRRLINGCLESDGWNYQDIAYAEGDAGNTREAIDSEDVAR